MNIIEQIYFVGDSSTNNGLDCNPYLLIDEEEAVLFDPGSVLDFEVVLGNIKRIIDINKIKYIVLHHEDPDFCGSVPLFEKLGIKVKIVTTWRTMSLAQYYGFISEYYLLEENNYILSLKSGRLIQFIPTPYLHFAGAFVSYDKKTKTLFSSDLFGAFSFNRVLYADDEYIEKMLTFHEHYMPSNSILRPVIDTLSLYSIDLILPQHGSFINRNISQYMEALRTLECGTLLTPLKKNLLLSGGYILIFNDILKRLMALYPKEKVLTIMRSMQELEFNTEDKIISYKGAPEDVWNKLFAEIETQAGVLWITAMEPFVRTLSVTYDIPMPVVFDSLIMAAELENKKLTELNNSMADKIKTVNERMTKCGITGLYNEFFLKSVLIDELEREDWRDIGAFVSIGIDNFSKYKLLNGAGEEASALNNMSYLLKESFGNNVVFKMDSTDFALYLKGYNKDELIEKLEDMRIQISRSDLFVSKITASFGVSFPNELKYDTSSYDMTVKDYMEISLTRLRKAKYEGKNRICYEGELEETPKTSNCVLIVDNDITNIAILKNFILKLGVEVYEATDGAAALKIAEEKIPDVIVTEINLPKMDGFLLKEKLLANTRTKNIEFIFLSYQKDEESVNRAQELGVTYYVKKPYLLTEVMGLIKRNIKEVNE